MKAVTVLCLTGGLLLGGAAGAGALVKCVGDSITEGGARFDEENRGGYPSRLQPLLREGGMQGVVVQNLGVGGQATVEMVGRIGAAISNGDTLVLLGGSNDVTRILGGELTVDDTISNLDFMLRLARDGGMRVIVGTLPPRPPGTRDDSNTLTYEVVQRIRQLAFNRRYEVADFWFALPNRERYTYLTFYSPVSSDDPVGHPNAAGFQLLAETAADVILEGDHQSPVEGRFLAPGPVPRVNADTDYEIELFDFDAGIFLPSATILLNGVPMETVVTGNRRKARLFAAADGRRRCKVVLSVRASDRAEPPNELDFFVTTFPTPQRLIGGDANGDCRVDGRDLAIFGPVFGKNRSDLGFDEEMDFVRNGVIDGDDFARLAANFGRGDLPAGATE
jgi:lysophospholipase L1-like esterase